MNNSAHQFQGQKVKITRLITVETKGVSYQPNGKAYKRQNCYADGSCTINYHDVADRASTGCKWKFHLIIFVFNYIFTSHTATRGKIENWVMTEDCVVELSRVGQLEHFHDSTQLVTLRKCSELQYQFSWVELVESVIKVFTLPDPTQLNSCLLYTSPSPRD